MEIGIAVDNTMPLHIPSFIEFIRANTKTMHCRAIDTSLRFPEITIESQVEIAKRTHSMRKELADYDLTLLVTTIPFSNNFFYEGLGGLFIISFSDWHLLTTLPMSNGLAYILCTIISKYVMNIGKNHDENTGCINDFWWDKRGIDVGMRAAFVCDHCKALSTNDRHLASDQFADIASILDAVSRASRRGVDILFELPSDGTGVTLSASNDHFDVFLCHNSQDKSAVRLLNETLRNGGIKTWLDEEQVNPGDVWQDKLESQISSIAACLVIVGDSGFGPWQDIERRAFITEFANRGCKIIPVLIGKSVMAPRLPLFLKQFMWSDLRNDDGGQVARIISALRR